jgi:hypothetical protein
MTKMNFTLLLLSCLLSANLFGQNVPSYVPTNGLVGWWPFNGNANDESGNGNNGTVNGATLTSDRFGMAGKAYDFDGVDDYCNLNAQLPDSFSLSIWAKIDSFKVYNGIGSELLSTFNQNFGSSGFVLRTDAVPNKVVSGFWNTSGNQIVSRSNVPQLQWNHFVVSYTSGLLKLHFNGLFSDSIVGSFVQNNQNIYLAARQIFQGNNPAFFADCDLDDIGIWNRALSQQEVSALYNGNLCYQTITVTDTLLINTNITGYNPVNYENTIKIWPNPAKTHITIDAGDLNVINGYSLRIVNAFGQQVFQSAINQQQFYLDLSNWTGAGIYYVNIVNPQGATIDIKKIVIQ